MSLILRVPGDKSISHRALILAALARGTSSIINLLESKDVKRTLRILQELGVSIAKQGVFYKVKGLGKGAFKKPSRVLDCGNSGTTLRLMTGLLAAQAFRSELTGDASLNKRPMDRVIEPLVKMGARIQMIQRRGLRIIQIDGAPLKGIHHRQKQASAQVKSALLLAGLFVSGTTIIDEPILSRDHTERLLPVFGARLSKHGKTIQLKGRQSLKAARIRVPGDFSSAAFLLAAGILTGRCVTLKGVGLNPTRTGFLTVLKKMGARVAIKNRKILSGEPVGDILIGCHSEPQAKNLTAPGRSFTSFRMTNLKAISIGPKMIPSLIDEIPILSILASQALGETIIRGASELRHKESDRIRVLVRALKKLGVEVIEKPDGLVIEGGRPFKGGVTLDGARDHRIVLALCIAGLVAKKPLKIKGRQWVSVSFPGFFKLKYLKEKRKKLTALKPHHMTPRPYGTKSYDEQK